MKKWVLCSLLVAWSATPAVAFVQSGHLPKTQPNGATSSGGETLTRRYEELSPLPSVTSMISPGPIELLPGQEDDPTQPVPEPGTMALASMGLLALGAAARKRRQSKS